MSSTDQLVPLPPAQRRLPSQTSGLDITAFVAAFALPLIGAVLGFVAINEAHKNGRQASGLAVAGAVLGSLFAVILTVVIIAVSVAASNAADPINQFTACLNGQLNGTVPLSTVCPTP